MTTFTATSNPNALIACNIFTNKLQKLNDIIEKSALCKRIFNSDNPNVETLQDSSKLDNIKMCKVHGGLVSMFVTAYCNHHKMKIRPDDFWQTIIIQFSFYINANAELLRDKFVNFPDKKTLVVVMTGTLHTVNYAEFVEKMVNEQIIDNIKDPEFVDWILPDFTTTTKNDRIAASVTIMATLQEFFTYVCSLRCGIPEVTLEGTLEDWIKLRKKIDNLKNYDINGYMIKWHSLLARILDKFIDCMKGNVDLSFWDSICKIVPPQSSATYLNGWVASFCVFTNKGEWQGNIINEHAWPHVDFDNLPLGITSVPVLVIENGIYHKTHMIVGQAAYEIDELDKTCIRPRSDWSMILDKGNESTINAPIIALEEDDDDYDF